MRGGFLPSKPIPSDEDHVTSAEELGKSAIIYSNRPLTDHEWRRRRVEQAIMAANHRQRGQQHKQNGNSVVEYKELSNNSDLESEESSGNSVLERKEPYGNSVVVAHPSLVAFATTTTQRTTTAATSTTGRGATIGLGDAKQSWLETTLSRHAENMRYKNRDEFIENINKIREESNNYRKENHDNPKESKDLDLPRQATPRDIDQRPRNLRLSPGQRRRHPEV